MFDICLKVTLKKARRSDWKVASKWLMDLCEKGLTSRRCVVGINLLHAVYDQRGRNESVAEAERFVLCLRESAMSQPSKNYVEIFTLHGLQKFIPYESEILLGRELPIDLPNVDPFLRRMLVLKKQDGSRVF